jgi:NhaC family Na+:H+ antiporter
MLNHLARTQKKIPSILDVYIPILSLIFLLALSIYFYGADSSQGANQIALIFVSAIVCLIGFKNGYTWNDLEEGMAKGIGATFSAILILMMVGALIGSWIISGTVPTMIYFGLQLLEPKIFYVAACLISAMVSISIGSSWTTAGTVGVALIGISSGFDLSPSITAGAIISGAYFGDKISPLSDTTNLASSVSGTDLFTHIRYMLWTTTPSFILALSGFAFLGFFEVPSDSELSLQLMMEVLNDQFNLSLFTLIPLLCVLILAFKRLPAFLTLLVGTLVACMLAFTFQDKVLTRMVETLQYECEPTKNDHLTSNLLYLTDCSIEKVENSYHKTILIVQLTFNNEIKHSIEILKNQLTIDPIVSGNIKNKDYTLTIKTHSHWHNTVDAIWRALHAGYTSHTGHHDVDTLLSRGGMASMLTTIWLILTTLIFASLLETIGILQRLIYSLLKMVNSLGSLIVAVVLTCLGINLTTGDQYIAIVLPGKMYRLAFKKRRLAPENLSRTLEDSATMTSVLIPWNTCGAYMAATLGVPTLIYLPFCLFNIISPFMSITYAVTHFKISKLSDEIDSEANNNLNDEKKSLV